MKNFYKKCPLILLLFQVFSTAPFSLNNKNTLFMEMTSFCSLLISLTLSLLVICYSSTLTYLMQNSVQKIVSVIFFFCVLITHFTIIAESYLTRRKQLQIIKNISTIDDILRQKLGKSQTKHNYSQYIFGICSLMLFTVFSMFLMDLRNTDWLYTLQYVYPIILIRVRCLQVIFYVDVLDKRLLAISDIVVHNINCEEAIKCQIKIINISKNIIQNPNSISYVELVALKKIYSCIWFTNYLMNDCFGWSLLFIFTLFFLTLTIDFYWLYLICINQFTNNEPYEILCETIGILSILWLVCNGCLKCTQNVWVIYIMYSNFYIRSFLYWDNLSIFYYLLLFIDILLLFRQKI